MKHLFPIFVNLDGKNCLVIGGGEVAERKIEDLLAYGAAITVISPQTTEKIKTWAEDDIIACFYREFQENDIENVFMVFAATNDNLVNKKIAVLCNQKGILLNAVDDPPNCDFFLPSILRRNSLAVAVSTEGKSPLYARKVRQDLEKVITEEQGEFVEILGQQREHVKNTISDIKDRKKVFQAIIDSDILDLLKAGEKDKVRKRLRECMSLWGE